MRCACLRCVVFLFDMCFLGVRYVCLCVFLFEMCCCVRCVVFLCLECVVVLKCVLLLEMCFVEMCLFLDVFV